MNELRELLHEQTPPTTIPSGRLVALVHERLQERRLRRRRQVGVAVVGVAATAVALTVIALGDSDAPTQVAGVVAEGMRTCGPVPSSSGPKADLLRATVTAPAQAASGAKLALTVNVYSVDGRSVPLNTGFADLLIARDGNVVGKYEGGHDDMGVKTGPIEGDKSASVPAVNSLLGCPSGRVDPLNPDAARPALPAGDYDLFGVVTDVGTGDGIDRSVIVSTPSTIHVQ